MLLVDPDSPVVDDKRRRQCLNPPSSFGIHFLDFMRVDECLGTLVEKGQRQRTTATRKDDDDDDDDDGRSARPVGLRSQARHDDDNDDDEKEDGYATTVGVEDGLSQGHDRRRQTGMT